MGRQSTVELRKTNAEKSEGEVKMPRLGARWMTHRRFGGPCNPTVVTVPAKLAEQSAERVVSGMVSWGYVGEPESWKREREKEGASEGAK